MEAAGQSSGEWPLWRPLLISRVAMPCVVIPSVVYFIVKLVAGLIRDPRMDPFGALILLFLVLGSLALAVGAVSVPWVKAQIEGDRLVFVNRFWSGQEIALSSISSVQPGSHGLDVTRIDGTVVSVHAITDFLGKSGEIDQVNADVTQAYSIANGIATGSCAGDGPGRPPIPIRHISGT